MLRREGLTETNSQGRAVVESSEEEAERTERAVVAMLLQSERYDALRLPLAAQYCAAGALCAVLERPDERVKRLTSPAAFRVAHTHFTLGNGITFLHSVGFALEAHARTAIDSEEWSKHGQVTTALSHATMLRSILLQISPAHLRIVDEALDAWPISDDEKRTLKGMSERSLWTGMEIDEIERRLALEMGVNPFSDFGVQTQLGWKALGVTWSIRHHRDAPSRLVACEIAAAVQLIQAEIGGIDLGFTQAEVEIDLRSDRPGGLGVSPIAILHDASALPAPQFEAALREALMQGRTPKALPLRPIRELLAFAQPSGVNRAALDLEQPLALTLRLESREEG
jgi:hypothetical protein